MIYDNGECMTHRFVSPAGTSVIPLRAICLGRESPRQFLAERIVAWRPVHSVDVLAPVPIVEYERSSQLAMIEIMQRTNRTMADDRRWNFHFDIREEGRGGMPRNISFMMTTDQVRNQTKTVTRRIGWRFLNVGDVLTACVKCQGIKKGEHIERICQIRVIGIRREPLSRMIDDRKYGKQEATREGFPEMSGREFVLMFIRSMRCEALDDGTRIEFEYMPEETTDA
ncbi:MAG: hypothetical protein AAFP90_02640 [Planctomycetota bacterium]